MSGWYLKELSIPGQLSVALVDRPGPGFTAPALRGVMQAIDDFADCFQFEHPAGSGQPILSVTEPTFVGVSEGWLLVAYSVARDRSLELASAAGQHQLGRRHCLDRSTDPSARTRAGAKAANCSCVSAPCRAELSCSYKRPFRRATMSHPPPSRFEQDEPCQHRQ